MKKISGTYEWASSNVNCVQGCSHECRYCFARKMAERFDKTPEGGWGDEQVNEKAVNKSYGKRQGIVMFPSVHDISPKTLDACLAVLRKLFSSGNQVLIVSKPHLECIREICDVCSPWKSQAMFRFTIGADDDEILSYWEPHAPAFGERFESLKHAHLRGWRTSVSMEPMLDSPNVVKVFCKLHPYVTDVIWIGKLNKARQRIKCVYAEDFEAVERIEEGQTDDQVRRIYAALKDDPKVRWKESFREILGIESGSEEWKEIKP